MTRQEVMDLAYQAAHSSHITDDDYQLAIIGACEVTSPSDVSEALGVSLRAVEDIKHGYGLPVMWMVRMYDMMKVLALVLGHVREEHEES